MEITEQINAELEKGFSKSDLEVLIGLPQNFLSGFLKGKKKLSKKCALKVDLFMKSEKPNPLDFKKVLHKVTENNLPENKKRINEQRNTVAMWKENHQNSQPTTEVIEYTDTQQRRHAAAVAHRVGADRNSVQVERARVSLDHQKELVQGASRTREVQKVGE